MKRLLLGTLLLAAVMPAAAVNADDVNAKTCKTYSELATSIMKLRQRGLPMMDVYEAANGDDTIEGMVKLAYEQPLMSSPEMKESLVTEFGNGAFRGCVTRHDYKK